MNKEIFKKIITILQEKSFSIKFECHIFTGKSCIRGIYIYNTNDKNLVKSLFDNNMLKYFKIRKVLSWYLGERKEILLAEFKDEFEIEIPELEAYMVNNYA
jgi:hypothetical protein